MTNGDREGRIFLSNPHTNNGFFFSLTIKYLFLYWKKTWKRLPENPEYAQMRHGDVILTLQWRHGSTCGQRADDVRLFVFYLSLGLVRVCEIIESIIGVQWGQKNPNPRAHRSSGKRGLPSFPLNGGPEGCDFSGTTEHQWSILFLIYHDRTVQCNICWWRHWGRCKQSMTRAVRINKQRIVQ